MFRELPQSKKAGTAHHLITVRKTPTHCLQHRWQQPNKERDQKVNILKSWWLLLVSQLTHNKSMGPQWKMNCLKKQKKEYMGNFFFHVSEHTWCVCGQHILQPALQDTWDPPSSDRGFHWQGMSEWEASETDTSEYIVKKAGTQVRAI